jgi:hypothetical protein
MFDLEKEIRAWQDFLRRRGGAGEADIAELEAHLRDGCAELAAAGLAADEAFLVAAKRLGNADALCREFAKSRTGLLWKQLFLEPADPAERRRERTELILVVLLGLAAGLSAKLAQFFAGPLDPAAPTFLRGLELRNLGLYFVPAVAVFLGVKRRAPPAVWLAAAAAFFVGGLAVNLYPFRPSSDSLILAALHLPLLLWLAAGLLYAGRDWRESETRLDFVRLTGEAFLYGVLILCGGAVLAAATAFLFSAIGLEKAATAFIEDYLAVFGLLAAPAAAVYLAGAKRSIVESLAPVLARIFAPFFLVLLAAFLIAWIGLGRSVVGGREYLIGFDLLLALVLAMVLYIVAARPAGQAPSWFDWLTLALIAAALAADGLALAAMVGRLAAWGGSPNRLAALGENVLLAGNLLGLAVLYLRYLSGGKAFARLIAFQTAYLALYAAWFGAVVLLLPPLFAFR